MLTKHNNYTDIPFFDQKVQLCFEKIGLVKEF